MADNTETASTNTNPFVALAKSGPGGWVVALLLLLFGFGGGATAGSNLITLPNTVDAQQQQLANHEARIAAIERTQQAMHHNLWQVCQATGASCVPTGALPVP